MADLSIKIIGQVIKMYRTEYRLFDFNEEVTIGQDIITEYLGKMLILKRVRKYNGPITMQSLPYGGIQSTYHGYLIIYTKSGFIHPTYVVYDDQNYTETEFVELFPDLVNEVLPC